MTVLTWEQLPPAMSTAEWASISADSAPPGVYTTNLSPENAQKWRAKLIRSGPNPRVEIRKTVTGMKRPAPARWIREHMQNYAQIKIIVDRDSVRFSANATADFTAEAWDELIAAVAEARAVLAS